MTTNNTITITITTFVISVAVYMLLPTTPVEIATTSPTPDELCAYAPEWVVDDCYAQAGGVSK